MIETNKIKVKIEEGLQETDRFLVGLNISPTNEIEVFIDSDTQVDISHCVELSKFLESGINREEEDYELNISSAGLDMPLRLARQYKKHVGQLLVIKTTGGDEMLMRLTETDENGIKGQPLRKNPNAKKGAKNQYMESEPAYLTFNEIVEAKIEIVF
jgi:ribosome maturation factor RimP